MALDKVSEKYKFAVVKTKKPTRGRPAGIRDQYWPERLITLLNAVQGIQAERYTVSMRELETACGVSRQTIVNWLEMAEQLGYVERHNGQPRALELLPEGRKLIRKFETLHSVKRWHEMRDELRREYDLRRGTAAVR